MFWYLRLGVVLYVCLFLCVCFGLILLWFKVWFGMMVVVVFR